MEKNEFDIKTEPTDKPDSNNVMPAKMFEYNKGIQGSSLFTVQREEYMIVCDMCDFQSNNHNEMDIHRLSHGLKRSDSMPIYFNSNMEYPTPTVRKNKGHLCDMCPYSSKTSAQLISHKKSHSAVKAYSCTQCSYSCKYLSGLRYHQLSHNNSKIYKCDECQFTCVTPVLLKSHVRKHSDIAPYSCHVCPYKSKYPAGLRYHILTHTKEKDISCDKCNYACRTMAEMKIHSRKHTPQSMMCDLCGFTCKIKKTLIQHKISSCRSLRS